MNNYHDIYMKRINRYGTDARERLEGGRRENFERFMEQSPHRVTFDYGNDVIPCVFEPHKQNETKTLMHILCRADQHFVIGDIVKILNNDYMIYYLDERYDSGYNRYVVVKMTHDVKWGTLNSVKIVTQWNEGKAYFYGQEDNALKNELKSRSRTDTLYLENLKLSFLLMPLDKTIKIDDYFIISTAGQKQYFRVTGFDIISTPNIAYVSVDPVYEYDLSGEPEPQPGEPDSLFFWYNGGES